MCAIPFSILSRYFVVILVPYSKQADSYVDSSAHAKHRLCKAEISQTKDIWIFFRNFDVVSLFTRIPVTAVREAINLECYQPWCSQHLYAIFEELALNFAPPSVIHRCLLSGYAVDDALALFPRVDDFSRFLSYLNSLRDSINFNLEMESEGSLSLLDRFIKRSRDGITFDVYRNIRK